MDAHHITNGAPTNANGSSTQARREGGLRLPTVQDALPFTPFSSIVPFNPDIIPPPVALPMIASSTFNDLPDVKAVTQVLSRLSAGADSARTASERCQQTLSDVQRFLDPSGLTRLKFKVHQLSRTPRQSTTSMDDRSSTLSPFAQMVLEGHDVSKRYLTPESEPHQEPDTYGDTIAVKQRQPPAPSYYQNHDDLTKIVTPRPEVSTQPPSGSQGAKLHAIIIPSAITPAQRAEYQFMPERDSLVDPTITTPSGQPITSTQKTVSTEQKHRGDAAVLNLDALLSQIFEAEDRLQPDTSGAIAVTEDAIFTVQETDDGSVPMLHHDMQLKLDSAIQKVISIDRMESIEVGRLSRVQRLCEHAVAVDESARLQIGEDWSEEKAHEWYSRILDAGKGMVAARTLLRIMGEGANVKELQSEDYLRVVLAALRNVTENALVPLAEERALSREKTRGDKEEPPSNSKFVIASTYQKPVLALLHATTKSLRTLGDFLIKSDMDESALSSVEYMCKLMIFTENASNDKDSIVGVQNFENTRRCAMDVLTKIFVKYTEQRQFILDEILTSLEKLPASKQSARQYRLVDAKPIQLVSALLMRLVQTSATYGGEAAGSQAKDVAESKAEDSSDEDASDEDDEDTIAVATKTKTKQRRPDDLVSTVKPLHDAAQSHATYIVNVLVQRALTTSKSSDEPYRKLLDIFTDDFVNVLGSADWPSAEMLLRALVLRMIGFVESPKSAVNARLLALELLGTIGSGLLGLEISARSAARTLDSSEGAISKRLADEVDELESRSVDQKSLVAFDGTYRMVIEYLQARDNNDAQLRSAQGYHLMQWASYVCGGREGSVDSDVSESSPTDLQRKLLNMILDPHWLEEHHNYATISTAQGRLAAMVATSSSKLCKAFNRIFSILLSSMSSEHPTVRSRSLKSIVILLQKDPSILDRNTHVINHISRCLRDASPLVRESALRLVADCIKLRPALESTVYDRVIERTRDTAIGVRKQSLKMLRDIYLRNDLMKARAAIADAVIARVEDSEESVAELARQIIEEIWFVPLHGVKIDGERAVEAKLRFGAQTTLLIRTLEIGDGAIKVLKSLIRNLVTQSKLASAHSGVCKTIVQLLFDGIIDNSELPESPTQPSILKCIAIFALASPKLITATQLERLEPYTQNLNRNDDLEVYRSAVTILRYVIPHHSVLRHDFLEKMQLSLLTSVARLPKAELVEVVPCLWTINKMLDNIQRLVKFLLSALINIYGSKDVNHHAEPRGVVKVTKLIMIAGQFGNACDFENQIDTFKTSFPWYKGKSVAALIADILCPFTSPKHPLPLREVSLEAVCTVSQAWPSLYLRSNVVNAFEAVFKHSEPTLEEVLLTGLEAYFSAQEFSTGGVNVPELGSGVASGTERLGRTYVATDTDGASTSLAQRFLSQFLRVALSSCDDVAYTAAKLIISINRQGHVHPKEVGPALVALETCPSNAIANQAFIEHKTLHSKHETLLDKEYMRAVQQAFDYQKGTVGSTTGYSGHPPVAKFHLLWEVLKTGKAAVRKKFLANFVQKMDFSLTSQANGGATPEHLVFVRFCCENLALLEYHSIEELQHLLLSLEKIFSGTGTTIAQAIENDVFKLNVETVAGSEMVINGGSALPSAVPADVSVDAGRLRQLSVASQICSLIWETRSFIRRVWNMQKYLSNPKSAAKESSKTPNRATNAPNLTEAYLKCINQIGVDPGSSESQYEMCRGFVELISTDSEVKVASEHEDNGELENGYDTPSEGTSRKSPSAPPSGGGARGKKRKSVSVGGTPRKKGRPKKAKFVQDEGDDEVGGWA